ncbi:MAG: SAM-dependent DNA methyltransferase [Fimbriimonadaceae bacterium]|nr:SAM-dependent DNA methyltransferase [Fimbriimonadaceae bacterium]
MARKGKAQSNGSGAHLGFEATLWAAADKLRGNIDASDYKHVVLGLIFLKYISDAFTERRLALLDEIKKEQPALVTAETRKGYDGAAPEATLPQWVRETLDDRDEYLAEHVFYVPEVARWEFVQAQAKQPTIGKSVDEAMLAIEKENPRLRGVLPKDYAREQLDKRRLGELVDLIGSIQLGDRENRSKDVLGRVYEYFLGQFASSEGKKGGEYFTPQAVVRILVEMLEPHEGARIYDPCCGSGGMFVQSEKFIEQHGGRKGRIAVYGQELNHTTWRLAQMNLAIRGIEATIEEGDTFHADKHPDLKADFIIANPPFNISDWGGDRLRQDVRWKFGAPPVGNANFGWVQHFIHHLAPNGTAGFVLANGSLSSTQSGEGEIRRAIVEADLVDCVVALPEKLFYTTGIPVCLWFLTRNKNNAKLRDRRGEVLFIDARKMGTLVTRVLRELSTEEIAKIAGTYHAWRGEAEAGNYEDQKGFCMSAKLADIREHNHILTPGRYVGAEDIEADDEPFEEKFARLSKQLEGQFSESNRLQEVIRGNLARLRRPE